MKTILIRLISCYQLFLSLPIRILTGTPCSCRFPVSCSEYALTVIKTDGALKGSWKAIIRLLSCQPFFRLA